MAHKTTEQSRTFKRRKYYNSIDSSPSGLHSLKYLKPPAKTSIIQFQNTSRGEKQKWLLHSQQKWPPPSSPSPLAHKTHLLKSEPLFSPSSSNPEPETYPTKRCRPQLTPNLSPSKSPDTTAGSRPLLLPPPLLPARTLTC